MPDAPPGMAVAIVGMGCRFPGGISSADALWAFLLRGGDAITEAPPGRLDLDTLYDPDPRRPGKLYARWGGFVDGIDLFDADFFGISPREARRIDPQQRMLLEVVWEALEDGGQPPGGLAGSDTGVFVGISGHDYADLQSQPGSRELIDVHVNAGGATSIAANRVSYLLDLHGPSVAVDTACSSALTAVHLACASLVAGDCGIAIAAAVNALLTPEPTIGFCKAGMLSPDGRCKPFDARADGYVRSDGAGAVVLKPLDRALVDGDPIYAVIRGTGINQDGRTPGISVPNASAQAALLRQVLSEAGVRPAGVAYVEAHGTGTPVGDPREAQAIGAVMADRPPDLPCLIGSVKGNLGHMEAAAGIAGLIKAALVVQRRQVPPTIHFAQPNPAIDFEHLRLQVPTTLRPWPEDMTPAVAGVNSFGFGGANAHAVLEEPPRQCAGAPHGSEGHQVVALSARSPAALGALAGAWVEHLRGTDASLADIAYTAAVRRTHHDHRLAVVGGTKPEVAALLATLAGGEPSDADAPGLATGHASAGREPRVAFVFSGMGPQWWGMGRRLLRDEPVFAEAIGECDRLLRPLSGWSLLEEFSADEQRSQVTEPFIAHVANLALQVALASLWRSWGIVPDAVVGHSSGEMAAACVAGALALPDAVRLAYHRGRLQHRTVGTGGMLAAGIAVDAVPGILDGYEHQVSLAAVNGPSTVALSGDVHALERVADRLERRGCFQRRLPVTVPYHGPQMDALRDDLLDALAHLAPRTAEIPIVSTVTGDWHTGELFDAAYWWSNVRQPVRFAAAVDRLAADGCDVFVELAPHPVLAPAVIEGLQAGGHDAAVLPSLRRGEDDRAVLLRALAALHVRGRRIAWSGVFGHGRRCVSLPRYPWQRERHWLPEVPRPATPGADTGHPLLGRRLHAARPTWQADLGDPRLDYLEGHLVEDRVTFPAAAHVEIALASARAWRGEGRAGQGPAGNGSGTGSGDGAVALEDVSFERVLAAGDRAAVTLQCLLEPSRSVVEIHSARRDQPDEWTLRARARVAARPPTDSRAVDLAAARARCATPVDVDTFYKTLSERHGLRYEGPFCSVTELWRGDGEALGRIVVPDEHTAVADGYGMYPPLLDAAFQVLGAAAAAALGPGAGDVLLPVSIARVAFHAPPGSALLSHATVTRVDDRGVEGSVTVVDDAGRVALSCTGLRLQLLGGQAAASPDEWLYETRWQPAPLPGAVARSIPPAGELGAILAPVLDGHAGEQRFDEYYTSVEPALNALTLHAVRDALQQLGFDAGRDADRGTEALAARLGVKPRQQHFFTRLVELSQDASLAAGRLPDDPEGAYPLYSSALRLVGESGRRLAGTLRGTEDAREWLVAGEWLDAWVDLYAVSPVFQVYLTAVAEAVATVRRSTAAGGTLRILEVGAGTGSATRIVLDRLPEGSCEYVFSDISPFFLRAARERFDDRPELTTRVLDIEDPSDGAGRFDVIVAADVVHATADVRAALRNLRALLAPGGLLVLLEAVRRSAWLDLVVGQLEGWWRASDRDLRPDHPLLGVDRWVGVLAASGFAEAAAVTDDTTRAGGDPSQVVLLATAPPAEPPSRPARRWLVLTDRRGVGPEVAARMRSRGDDCVLVWPGSEYRQFGADGFQLAPPNPADWTRLLAEVATVDGVIALWALDAPEEPAGSAELMAFQEASCGWVVAFMEALLAAGRTLPGDVWLVTAGAQAADHDHGGPAGVGAVAGAPSMAGVAQAPLWGLGRVLRTEQGSGCCRLVDLSPSCTDGDVAALLAELDLADAEREDEVALRDGQRLARRLRPASPDPAWPQPALPGDERRILDTDGASFRLEVGRPGDLTTLGLRETGPVEPGPGEVVLRVVAAALNFRDVLVALGVGFAAGGQDPATAPLGWECAGIVAACGAGVEDVAVGDEVIAIAAGAIGSRVLTRADRVAGKPACLSFEDAATLPVAFLTAQWALERLARLEAGERVLVHTASGGVGLAAVQVAQRAGAQVFATAGTHDKREHVRSLGVEYAGDSRTLDFADEVLRLTGGEGVDVVLNTLSGEAIDRGLEILRPNGRFVEIAKRDIYEGGRISLAPFRRNLSYHALDLQPLYGDRPALIGGLLRGIVRDVEAGTIQPLPCHVFDLADGEQAFRLMAQARHIGKVVLTAHAPRYVVQPRKDGLLCREGAAYVVTGGLGGFGLSVAAWLVREGAGNVVLVSRSGVPRDEDAAALAALTASRAQVEVVRGDVADPDDAARVLDHVRRTVAPLRGVIHAAMVLDDALLGKFAYSRFDAVLAPKLAGAWNLHELTAGDELDFFVLFSSISALIGQPAQASYAAANEFLGALAAHRRARGQPALTVDWGVITGAGYVARHPELQQRMHRQGLRGIPPDGACAMLGELIRRGAVRMGVSSVDWSAGFTHSGQAVEAAAPGGASRPVPQSNGERAGLRARLAVASAEDRAAEVERYVLAVTARVLETAPGRIDVERRLSDMGIDSLMAVELQTALRAEADVEVPLVDLLEQLSVRRLAEAVAQRMDGHGDAR